MKNGMPPLIWGGIFVERFDMTLDLNGVKFGSKDEVEDLCRFIASRLHYLNRTAMGESRFVWELADMMKRAGTVFAEHYDDKATRAAFGDGYSQGTVAREDMPAALFALMYPTKDD